MQHGGEVATAKVAGFSDSRHQHAVDSVDGALWGEMETGLRHQDWVPPKGLILMVLGALAAMRLMTTDGVGQPRGREDRPP